MSNSQTPNFSSTNTSTPAASSRSGNISIASAGITAAELDTIEAEIKTDRVKVDFISSLISVFSAVIVPVKIIQTENWHLNKYDLLMGTASIGLACVQIYRLMISLRTKKSEHQKNAEKYIENLRIFLNQT